MKKKYLVLLLVLILMLSVFSSCKKDNAPVKVDDPATMEEKYLYAVGGMFYRYYEQAYELNAENVKFFVRGIYDEALGRSLFTEEEGKAAFDEYVQFELSEMAEKNKKIANEFLENNKYEEGVICTESGLQYKVLQEGTGVRPTESDIVSVRYTLTDLDGNVLDSSDQMYEESAIFPVNGLIAGAQEGLCLMTEGSKYQFWIPSELGYGDAGQSNIQPGLLLVFEFELLEVNPEFNEEDENLFY